MRFWDASALVPLIITEPQTRTARTLLEQDSEIVLWWGAPVECASALARSWREDRIDRTAYDSGLSVVQVLQAAAFEIQPSEEVRDLAGQLLGRHSLRAADALQLAAALIWRGERTSGVELVCLDNRLRESALAEGFDVMPASEGFQNGPDGP